MFARPVFPNSHKCSVLDAGLTKAEYMQSRALLGLVSDKPEGIEQLESRARLAIDVAQQASVNSVQLTKECWGLDRAYPMRARAGNYRLQFDGLTVLEYVTGQLLTGSLRGIAALSTELIAQATERAVKYARAYTDTLSAPANSPAFPCQQGKGLSHRDRLEIEILAQMLAGVDDSSNRCKMICDAVRIACSRPRYKTICQTKNEWLQEQLAPWEVTYEGVTPVGSLTQQWEGKLGVSLGLCAHPEVIYWGQNYENLVHLRLNKGLTIREWMVGKVLGGIIVNYCDNESDPDSALELAIARVDKLIGVLQNDWGSTVNPADPAFPMRVYTGNRSRPAIEGYAGIDEYCWLGSQILAELSRTYAGDWGDNTLTELADYTLLQCQIFWLESASHASVLASTRPTH